MLTPTSPLADALAVRLRTKAQKLKQSPLGTLLACGVVSGAVFVLEIGHRCFDRRTSVRPPLSRGIFTHTLRRMDMGLLHRFWSRLELYWLYQLEAQTGAHLPDVAPPLPGLRVSDGRSSMPPLPPELQAHSWYGNCYPDARRYLCCLENQPVALCSIWFGPLPVSACGFPLQAGEAAIVDLFCLPAFRRHGIGQFLKRQVSVSLAGEAGLRLKSRVWLTHRTVRHLNRRAGWQRWGVTLALQRADGSFLCGWALTWREGTRLCFRLQRLPGGF